MGPVCCKVDTKRLLLNAQREAGFDSMSNFEINCSVDMISINLGQKDFSIINLMWTDSIRKIISFCGESFCVRVSCPAHGGIEFRLTNGHAVLVGSSRDCYSNTSRNEETDVRKLEAFLYQTESNWKQMNLHANFEGLQICLYNDIDEVGRGEGIPSDVRKHL